MTNLEFVLQNESLESLKLLQLNELLAAMTPAALELCHRCPPGTIVRCEDEKFRVIGYMEAEHEGHAHLLVARDGEQPEQNNLISVCPNNIAIFRQGELN